MGSAGGTGGVLRRAGSEDHVLLDVLCRPADEQGVVVRPAQSGGTEHRRGVGHGRDVPRGQRPVEGGGAQEHVGEVAHSSRLPLRDVADESGCASEHAVEIQCSRGIPLRNSIALERRSAPEHAGEVGDGGHVPVGKIRVDERRRIQEGVGQVGGTCQVGGIGGRDDHVGRPVEGAPVIAQLQRAPLADVQEFQAVPGVGETPTVDGARDSDRTFATAGVGVGDGSVVEVRIRGSHRTGAVIPPVHLEVIDAGRRERKPYLIAVGSAGVRRLPYGLKGRLVCRGRGRQPRHASQHDRQNREDAEKDPRAMHQHTSPWSGHGALRPVARTPLPSRSRRSVLW